MSRPTGPRLSQVWRGAPTLTSRARSWLLLACAASLVGVYLVGWGFYATTHTVDRFEQLAPGARASVNDAEVRVVEVLRTTRLDDADGGEPELAPAGVSYVVATVEVLRHADHELFVCRLDLVGPGQRQWETENLYVERSLPVGCSTDDVRIGQPYRYLAVYAVPDRFVDGLYGLALEPYDGQPKLVLTPPRS